LSLHPTENIRLTTSPSWGIFSYYRVFKYSQKIMYLSGIFPSAIPAISFHY